MTEDEGSPHSSSNLRIQSLYLAAYGEKTGSEETR